MEKRAGRVVVMAALLLGLLGGWAASRSRAQQVKVETAPVAYVWGHQLSVYYPNLGKIYVYSELGGNCVFAYTLSTPGGPIQRENCPLPSR